MTSCLMITVVHNAERWLPEFLDSAAALIAGSRHQISLQIIDNASSDRSRQISRPYTGPAVALVENADNVGFARANNQAIRRALSEGFDFVLLVNNDTVLPEELVDKLIDASAAVGAEMVTPCLVEMRDRAVTSYAGARFLPSVAFRTVATVPARLDSPFCTGYAPACCLLVNSAVFDRIGLMDERFFVYAEDLDFMIRAASAGVRLAVEPAVRVPHATGSSTGGSESDFTVTWSAFGRAVVVATHAKGPKLISGMLYLAGWLAARLFTGRSSLHATRLRAVALLRGCWVGRRVPPLIQLSPAAAPVRTRAVDKER